MSKERRSVQNVSQWLLSWKTQATLAVLGGLYAVVGFIGGPINWSTVITGASVAGGSGWLATNAYRAERLSSQDE